ncbi:hypothetical protein [Jannaschia seohaensis]|uniref:Lipoprotein n=1 Tax=Jannaschia seohaensis TaxID=475081 RepID=A0A2Y9AEH0_9RHOB|nr:hypothetical protein [Jannaschia seohaensis]PWJ21258.1 hypothetical protein BCF38_102508 [Jannaschia seohaensis]SSA41668.1 hypothetical protein SAMN05421539_102508 [Jannaschia seohaensis]
MRRAAPLVVMAAALAGCVGLSGAVPLRPGLAGGETPAAIQPGTVYRWSVSGEFGGQAIPSGTITLRAVSVTAEEARLTGTIALPLGEEADLTPERQREAIAALDAVIGRDTEAEIVDGALRFPAEIVLDADRRAVASLSLSPRVRHEPHDCSRVPGDCVTRTILPDGSAIRVEIRQTERDGIWTARSRADDGTATTTRYSVDPSGVLLDSVLVQRAAGGRGTFTLRRL